MGIQSWNKKGGAFSSQSFNGSKKKLLVAGVLILVLAIIATLVVVIKNGAEKKVEIQKQKVEESRQMRMSAASWSRISFFESLPINATFAMPDYLEGNYRLVKGPDQATFLYIKDPSNPVEMLHIKVFTDGTYKLDDGETDLSSDCKGYRFTYKLASGDSYNGQDKDAFSQAIYDLNYFLSNDGYFECRSRN